MNEQLPVNFEDQNSELIYKQTLEQFKSIFYLVKGKRDTQIKLYSDNKSFTGNSLIELNEIIQEKLRLHTIQNKLSTISVTLSNNHIISYGNWQEFLNEKWNTSQKTDSITINWDFEMILPNRIHTLPQTHSLKVRFGKELKPNELLHIMMVGGDEFELEESQAQMVAKVDFVNASIATELLEKVNSWYSALPLKKEENKLNEWFNRHSNKLMLATEILVITAGLAMIFPIIQHLLGKPNILTSNADFIKYNFYIVASVFLTFTIFTRLGTYYARKIDRTIDKLQGTPLFEITNGDKNELERILRKNKSLRSEIILKLFISLISSGILFGLGHLIKYILEIKSSS